MALISKLVRHPLTKLALYIVVILAVFAYGLLVGRYKIFPYQQVVSLKEKINPNPFVTSTHDERQVQLFEVFGNRADLVLIGDSHTEFGMWSEYFTSRTIANRGIFADTTGDVLARMDTILSSNPKTAYVMLGVNDIFEELSIEEIIINYQEIVSILKSNNIEVIVQSIVQCHSHRCAQDKIAQINTLNERLEKLAKDEAIDFLYLEGLSNQTGLTDEMTYDGIHLTAAGYKLWLSHIAEHLGK